MSSMTFRARESADPALDKPRAVSMGPSRNQLANRMNGAAKAKRLALMLTTGPLKFKPAKL